MSDLNLRGAPYYDDFDPNKKFLQILAVPGRAEQAREFTQIQTILLHIIKKLSNALLHEGSIIEGCGFTFVGEDQKTLRVEPGKIYLDGVIHDFDGGEIRLTKVGQENVGVKLVKTIVTESDDESLLDPAEGFINYRLPGAHRLKAEVKLVLNDDNAPTIYRFYDGELQREETRPQLEVINQILARRTFDESGNYKVEGLNMWTSDYDENNILLTVEAGKAYVQGFEVNRPSPARVLVPKALDTRAVLAEPKVYQNGTDLYKLNNKPVKDINKVTATVEVTSTITRGSIPGGSDFLPKAPVVSVVSVTQGGTTYVQGVDFQLSGDAIDWSLNGNEPAIGTTYTVVYRYNKTMVKGTDYKLTTINEEDYVDFSPSGDNPVHNTTFTVDYDYYLARHDRVYLDAEGNISIVHGQSDRRELAKAPIDADPYRLSLGVIKLAPKTAETEVENTAITRVSMSDIHKMLQRLDNLEYNQALDNLDQEAMEGEQANNLKGIFTDGFIGFTKADLGHPEFSAAIDIANFELIHGADQHAYKPKVNPSATSGIKRYDGDKFFTLSYTEKVIISQPLTTGTLNINPYNAFGKRPSISINPEKDNWINESNVTINQQTTEIRRVQGWWNSQPDVIENLGTRTRVIESIIPFARQIEIEVEGRDFPYNADIEGYIDGVKVDLVPTGTTIAGSAPGTVKSNAVGEFTCKFMIPPGIRTGSREVSLVSGNVKGTAIFTSEGINRTIETTVLTRRIVTQPYDPLAQSFQLTESRFVTSVDLYFSNKDTTENCVVQIRNMVNGFPGTEVLAEKVLTPAEVNVSADGTVPTNVQFDRPVFCEKDVQYCIVLATSSDKYAVHVAKMGANLLSGGTVVGQPYLAGVLFSSSNALTWTPHQDTDLKFNLKVAEFNSNGTLEFNFIDQIDIDSVVLLVNFDILEGTVCAWEYKDSLNGSWLPLEVYGTKVLNAPTNMIAIRAKLSTSNNKVSPIISGEELTLVGLKTSLNSSYISRLVTTSQPYTTVKQIIEAYIPSGSQVSVKLTIDDSTWVSGNLTSTEQVDAEFMRYTYEYTIPDAGTSTKFRARIDLTSENRVSQPRVRKLMNIIK